MTIRQSLTYNKHLFKSDGPCKGKLQAAKQKQQLKQLKEELRDVQALHRVFLKAAVAAQKELKLQLQTLQDELAEEKALALEALNDRAEVVGDLMKRAVPEGWEISGLCKDGWTRAINRHLMSAVDRPVWRWCVQTPAGHLGRQWGDEKTLFAAVQQAELVRLPKAKKQRR